MWNNKKEIFKSSNILEAIDDVYDQAFPISSSNELSVLDNDSLGYEPTTITSVDTTGLDPDVATVSINIGGLTLQLNVGTGLNSGVTYTFTYTITDANGDTSTATVSFQDVS